MHKENVIILVINIIGGSAVVGSYVHGISTHAGGSSALWGGIPETLKPIYMLNMLLAATGYLILTIFM
jgi:hypothetical protein